MRRFVIIQLWNMQIRRFDCADEVKNALIDFGVKISMVEVYRFNEMASMYVRQEVNVF